MAVVAARQLRSPAFRRRTAVRRYRARLAAVGVPCSPCSPGSFWRARSSLP